MCVFIGGVVQGLLLLQPGGDLLLRMHSCYTRSTVSLLLLLSACFNSVCLYKPPSIPTWCLDIFFLGRDRRKEETAAVLQLLFAAWGLLAARHKAEAAAAAAAAASSSGETATAAAAAAAAGSPTTVNWGGLTAHWALQQFIKAKLFTDRAIYGFV